MIGGFTAAEVDTSRPHPARMYNAFLGGKDNYAADQFAAAEVLRVAPEVRVTALENRAFIARAVRHLVGDAGVRQIIDIGTGIPAAGAVHEVADHAAPNVRVAYVDNDPIVHVHAQALLSKRPATSIVLADLRKPTDILEDPRVTDLIDFSRPVALLLAAILHFITDAENPGQIVATLRDTLAPGSYLVLSHATGDFRASAAVRAAAVYETATAPMVLRDRSRISEFFDGFEILDPGIVPMQLWRPEGRRPKQADAVLGYCGVGRK